MNLRDDYLMRYIRRFIAMLIRILLNVDTGEEREQDLEEWVGMRLDAAEELPVEQILARLSAGGDLPGAHAMLLGLGLARRAIDYDSVDAHEVAMLVGRKAFALIRAGIEEDPTLEGPDLEELLLRLDGLRREGDLPF